MQLTATRSELASIDRRATAWGLAAVGLALAVVLIVSGNLAWFDAALVGYLFGTFFAIFAVVYRYCVWLSRPPTARLNRRGWEAFARRRCKRGRNLLALPGLIVSHLLLQNMIRHRSVTRWAAHQLIFWGCLLAAAVTFPLVFGLVHFESPGQDARQYTSVVMNVETPSFDSRSVIGWIIFHLLDISAVLVLAGVFLFLSRRMRDAGALAVERSNDFLPLAGLFAVSVTGLALTASNLWMDGRFYVFLNTVHALTVILGLMYIPFGKLFHIFQRPANVGVEYYKREGAEGPQQHCVRCDRPYASALQVGDLKEVLPQVGFDYTMPRPSGGERNDGNGTAASNYQDHCPPCKRQLVTLAQSLRVSGGFG